MQSPAPLPGLTSRALREPVVHFIALALVLFLVNVGAKRAGLANALEIDTMELEARILALETSMGRALDAEERGRVREAYIDEQVLVAEAFAMGLEHDAQIHNFLAQKMLHVLSADVIQPSDGELQAYFDANRSRYTSPATVTLNELVVRSDGDLPASLLQQLRNGVPPEQLKTELPHRSGVLADTSPDELLLLFGEGTARLVSSAAVGDWVGPHETVRGEHWFYVSARTREVDPPLDSVREQVRLDWIQEQEDVRLERRVRELRDQYHIVFSGDGTER